jgi:hypothetical protein
MGLLMAAPAWGLLCPRHGLIGRVEDTTGRLRPRTALIRVAAPLCTRAMTSRPPTPRGQSRAHGTSPTPLAPHHARCRHGTPRTRGGGGGGVARGVGGARCVYGYPQPHAPRPFPNPCAQHAQSRAARPGRVVFAWEVMYEATGLFLPWPQVARGSHVGVALLALPPGFRRVDRAAAPVERDALEAA